MSLKGEINFFVRNEFADLNQCFQAFSEYRCLYSDEFPKIDLWALMNYRLKGGFHNYSY